MEQLLLQLLLLFLDGLNLLNSYFIRTCTWDLIKGRLLTGLLVSIAKSLWFECALLHFFVLQLLSHDLHRRNCITLLVLWFLGHYSALLIDGRLEEILLLFRMAVALMRMRLSL